MKTIRKNNLSKPVVWLPAAVLAVIILYILIRPSSATDSDGNVPVYVAKRGNLTIKVVESGTVKALNAAEIRSEVEGEATIISIVPEGTFITEEDVKNGKILVELDAGELTDRLNQQEITYNKAEADYTEAKESLDIQKNQNDSDIQKGLLNVRFAMMDLQKYLGDALAEQLVQSSGDKGLSDVSFTDMIFSEPNSLGGESLQKYRTLTADIDLAAEELERARNDLDWTIKLREKEYVSQSDLLSDRFRVKRLDVQSDQRETALELFKKYEFSKEAQKLLSDYMEAKRELQRIEASTRSKLAQAQAKLRSNEATYNLQKERFEKFSRQVQLSVIRAPAPGLVVYSSQQRYGRGGSRSAIEAGAQVYQRQQIMTLPNAMEMAVDVKVHETNIDKIRIGQQARVTIDALPDVSFTGQVLKIAPLPDPQHWLGNPDLKVYSTDVSIVSSAENSIRPGMSAKVEIIAAQLADVIAVPIQSVSSRAGGKVCYVLGPDGPQQSMVSTGAFNDTFVEITAGIEAGQKVLLNPPRLLAAEERSEEETSETDEYQMQQQYSAEISAGQAPTVSDESEGSQRPERPDRPGQGTQRRTTRESMPAGARRTDRANDEQ